MKRYSYDRSEGKVNLFVVRDNILARTVAYTHDVADAEKIVNALNAVEPCEPSAR